MLTQCDRLTQQLWQVVLPKGTLSGPVSPASGHVFGAQHEELLVPLCVDGPVGGGPGTVAIVVGVASLGKVGPVGHHGLGQPHLFLAVPEVGLVQGLTCLNS